MITRRVISRCALLAVLLSPLVCVRAADWTGDLTPIGHDDWNAERAAHLLERAGFGATPEEIAQFAAMTPETAVRQLIYHKDIANDLPAFDHSGVHDPGLEPFPVSRPAATDQNAPSDHEPPASPGGANAAPRRGEATPPDTELSVSPGPARPTPWRAFR